MMADRRSRRNIVASRLRAKHRKNNESLADQFEFKMFVIVSFKNETKKKAVFEVDQVHPVMTNDYEQKIMERANCNEFDVESSIDLLTQDVVQLHARRWQSKRRDVIGCTDGIDFMIWPRNDLQSIECRLFSRWKHDKASTFRPLSNTFTIHHSEYETQLAHHREVGPQSRYVLSNSEQRMFLFLSRHSIDPRRGGQAMIFRMNSLCVYVPQAELMSWGPGTMERAIKPLLDNI